MRRRIVLMQDPRNIFLQLRTLFSYLFSECRRHFKIIIIWPFQLPFKYSVVNLFTRFEILWSVFGERKRPTRFSSSTSSQPSHNRLCHSKPLDRDITISIYISVNIQKLLIATFSSFTKCFKVIRCWMCMTIFLKILGFIKI